MMRFVPVVLLLCWSSLAQAQFPNLAEVQAQYYPSTELPEHEGFRSQQTAYDVAINVPVPLGERTFLIPGLAYHADSISFRGVPEGFNPPRLFQSVELSALFVQLLPKNWALSFRLSGALAGDYEDIDAGLIQVGAMAMATKSFGEEFTFGFGGLLSTGFGQLLPLPAIYAEWKPSSLFRIETFLPAFATAVLSPGDRFEFSLRADVAGQNYGMRSDDVRAACSNLGRCVDNIAVSTVAVKLDVAVRLFSSLWLNAYVGRTLFRRYEERDDDGDRVMGGLNELPNAFVAGGGLAFRIPQGD